MGTKCHIPMILKLEGQQKVWIMTDDDLNDTWSTLSKGTGSLWWYGVRKSAKQLYSSGEESDALDEPPLKKAKARKSVSASEDKKKQKPES